jgi:hypothetical protein
MINYIPIGGIQRPTGDNNMQIQATASGMKSVSTEQLREHVISIDAKFDRMPASLRRNSMDRWTSNRAAIIREIARRENAAA